MFNIMLNDHDDQYDHGQYDYTVHTLMVMMTSMIMVSMTTQCILYTNGHDNQCDYTVHKLDVLLKSGEFHAWYIFILKQHLIVYTLMIRVTNMITVD